MNQDNQAGIPVRVFPAAILASSLAMYDGTRDWRYRYDNAVFVVTTINQLPVAARADWMAHTEIPAQNVIAVIDRQMQHYYQRQQAPVQPPAPAQSPLQQQASANSSRASSRPLLPRPNTQHTFGASPNAMVTTPAAGIFSRPAAARSLGTQGAQPARNYSSSYPTPAPPLPTSADFEVANEQPPRAYSFDRDGIEITSPRGERTPDGVRSADGTPATIIMPPPPAPGTGQHAVANRRSSRTIDQPPASTDRSAAGGSEQTPGLTEGEGNAGQTPAIREASAGGEDGSEVLADEEEAKRDDEDIGMDSSNGAVEEGASKGGKGGKRKRSGGADGGMEK